MYYFIMTIIYVHDAVISNEHLLIDLILFISHNYILFCDNNNGDAIYNLNDNNPNNVNIEKKR